LTQIVENGQYRVERNTTPQFSANGNDTYLFGRGDGQDTVIDGDYTVSNSDTLRFKEDVAPADVKLIRSGNDLVLAIRGSSDQVTLKQYFDEAWNGTNGPNLIERIAFADGTVLSFADVQAMLFAGSEEAETIIGSRGNDVLTGQGGDDVLLGGAGRDVLDGGAGDDVLRGGGGLWGNQAYDWNGEGDTYLFGRGDGQDTIIDDSWLPAETDRIELKAGITADDVRLERVRSVNGWQVDDSLRLTIRDTGETLIVKNHFNESDRFAVEEIVFADGTVWSREDIKNQSLIGQAGDDELRGFYDRDDIMFGGAGNDQLQGMSGNDTLSGGAGNDLLQGMSGNDTLSGDAGNDLLQGMSGDDELSGGAGNDNLEGGTGSDIYHFGLGDGQDVITEDYDSNQDVLVLGSDLTPDNVTVRWTKLGEMTLTLADGSRVTVRDQAEPWSDRLGVDKVRFANGTTWDRATLATRALAATSGDDAIVGGYASDTLNGGKGQDYFQNLGGYDTYQFGMGDGQDVIENSKGRIVFKAGIGQNDVAFTRDGNDLIATVNVSATSSAIDTAKDSIRMKDWLTNW
jgi:Ca2+-binding RTX toxin-like protein